MKHADFCREFNRNGIVFGNLQNLKILKISSKKLISLPESIGNLKNLQNLNISSNQLTSVPNSIGHLKNLKILCLSNGILESIPNTIGDLKNLLILSLNSNNLSSLPDSIKRHHNLKELDISSNRFRNIPKPIGELQNLKEINISYNPFKSLESFKYILKRPELKIICTNFYPRPSDHDDFAINALNLLDLPEKVKNLWYDRKDDELIEYYNTSIFKIAEKYVKNSNLLTKHEIERLNYEAVIKERELLELYLPKDDDMILKINNRLKFNLANGFELFK